MPELPEVETVRAGLAPSLEGRRIVNMQVNRPDLRFPFPPDFAARLTQARLVRLSRRGKYLLGELEKDGASFTWLSHLGMSGRYVLTRPEKADPSSASSQMPGVYANAVAAPVAQKHVHVDIEFEGGVRLAYADPRRFGFMDLIDGPIEHNKFLADMGPEPLGNGFHVETLLAACRGRKSPIKNVLLDQRVVAGLGNIYVCEALFMAGISPRRQAANLGARRAARLVPAIRDVLATSIEAGGSSLRDFAHGDGKLGYFQHRFQVYDREGVDCSAPACRAKVKRIVQSGRSSFYCPQCQT